MTPERNRGFVYFFKCDNLKNQYKIGYSKNPIARAKTFNSCGIRITILKTIESERARDIESEMHALFHKYSHWNIMQQICNSRTICKQSCMNQIICNYTVPSCMSCEWFYLKPKRVIEVLEAFTTNDWGVVV